MTWVKICGITNLEDAEIAVAAGADALGFVFYEKSPRNIDPETARKIVAQLPEHVEKVGVFVQGSGVQPAEIILQVRLTAIQSNLIYPPPDSKTPQVAIGPGVWPRPPKLFVSFPITFVLEEAEKTKALAENFAHLHKRDTLGQPPIPEGVFDTFFLDSGTLVEPGGTGKVFDWEKAVPIAEGMAEGGLKLVVAGGLTPTNVGEAMRILKPWGVDVSSGVEARPGKKDPKEVRAFIAAVRQADQTA